MDKDSFLLLYSSSLVALRSPLRSCILAIRGQHTLPINKDLSVFNKRLHATSTAAPSATALSISPLSSDHPTSDVAPNFIFTCCNSGVWLTEEREGHNTQACNRLCQRKQKTRVCSASWHHSHHCFPTPYMENQGDFSDNETAWLTLFILSWINAQMKNWALFFVSKSADFNHYWPRSCWKGRLCSVCMELDKPLGFWML